MGKRRMFMDKILLTIFLAASFCMFGCDGGGSQKACVNPAYCYKTTDNPNKRLCDLDKAVAETKAKQAEEAGILHAPVYEDCWDF